MDRAPGDLIYELTLATLPGRQTASKYDDHEPPTI
jgi:hypothetical protein